MNTKPLVSICMPLYNAADFLDETLTKLNEQTYSNIEVIIVNDHSTDNSLDIAKKYKSDRVKIFTNAGKGACSARNYAFSKATGAFIKFMDADDYCMPKLIEKQVDSLVKGTEKTVIFSPLMHLYSDGSLFKPPRTIDHDYDDAFNLQIEIMKGGGTNVPHCYLMPRELVIASGGWDETVLKNQDGEYFSRVLANADKALCVPDEFAIYRKVSTGLSTKLSIEAVSSVLETYTKVINLAIQRNNTNEMRKICGRYLGLFVFVYYSQIKPLLRDVENISKQLDIQLIMPERKIFKILRPFLGWKNTVALMHKLGMVNKP